MLAALRWGYLERREWMKGWPLDLVILGSRQAPPWMKLRGFFVSWVFNGEWGNEGRGAGGGGGELTLPSRRSGRDFDDRDQGFGGGGRGRKAAPEGV